MTVSARTPPYLTHQSDEKGRLETYVVDLEGQIEGQKARLAELEAALERRAEATTEAPMEEGSETECQRRVTCRRVWIDAAADPSDRERVALRRGQLTSNQAEARQNRRIDSTGVTDPVRPYRPARKRKSPDVAGIDNAVHQVQCHLRAKMIVADVDRLAPYLGAARDEQP
jgi:hypothetical protein